MCPTKKTMEDHLYDEIVGAGFPIPKPQYKFHPTRKWRFDFAYPDAKVAIEVQGGVWSKGKHARAKGLLNDYEKFNEAQKLGWSVFLIPSDWIGQGAILSYLEELELP